jgi:aminoglycoside phosphotransferase (APT) family kinase protein
LGLAVDPDGRLAPDARTVRKLLNRDVQALGALPLRRVRPGGWDNVTYRLGASHTVRLPSAGRYVAQVRRETLALELIAPRLPFEVPRTAATGEPGFGYPYPWSVRHWIDGQPPDRRRHGGLAGFGTQLARYLHALWSLPTDGGPLPGADNFYRGGDLRIYAPEVERCLQARGRDPDTVTFAAIWREAERACEIAAPTCWLHGDLAAPNMLLRDGNLAALIDFGQVAVGDPACDLAVFWTLLHGPGRVAFSAALETDDATWARARGWALWKALLVANDRKARPAAAGQAIRTLGELAAVGR